MNTQIFIPSKIKVGYNKREDTYSKKLAYVIYYDDKGVLRKEASWQSWRDKQMGDDEFENKPLEGFVLNKGVGGARQSYGWNARNEYIRIYDPRGFEFEISVANLLFILQETSCVKGKGLEGEFVYGWQGTELVLLPTHCNEYKAMQEYTQLQGKKVSAKEYIVGATYKNKQNEELIYMGRFDYVDSYYGKYFTPTKKHIFYTKKRLPGIERYGIVANPSNIGELISDECLHNYADVLEKLLKLEQFSTPASFHIKKTKYDSGYTDYYSTHYFIDETTVAVKFGRWDASRKYVHNTMHEFTIKDGKLTSKIITNLPSGATRCGEIALELKNKKVLTF